LRTRTQGNSSEQKEEYFFHDVGLFLVTKIVFWLTVRQSNQKKQMARFFNFRKITA